MKYSFSNFRGRLSAPSPLEVPSKFGQGGQEPVIHYPTGTRFPKEMPARKGFYRPVPDVLLRKMSKFQIDNGLPVHIKGGVFDKLLYGITGVVCMIGVLECFRVYYVLAYPPKKED
ncbi:hypothetical protein SK128_024708 [Halocaridina rubra]|uniref:Uncharacterized protein n=1 Tax=Halocaridina rubra TaxID=373956 RepID=A0AAN9A981_HALRR